MPREEDIRLSFVSQALAEDTFIVAEFKGAEGISQLYEFEILLYAEDPEIDLKAVLQSPATLTIAQEGDVERKIHGIPATFEQLHEFDDYIYYRLNLVPRLWLADQYHENALFLEKKVPEIIEEILKQAGLTSQDYELKLTGSYNPWEYVCQYNETDFDFISRWMEREGIYYYFDQSGDAEKLIIADNATAHEDIEGGAVAYSPPSEATPGVIEQMREFTCRQQILPKKVILKDYNYRKPSLDLKGEADVDTDGRGEVYIYGEHFKTPEEGNALARIRAEELLCREAMFYGESTVSPFVTGYLYELEEHYRDSYNQKYLITEVSHQAVQADFLAMSADTSRITALDSQAYENRITCIPEDKQFRPERKTTKPRIDGTLNAKVDAAGNGQYAEIDEEGRYKIKLPFDQSDAGDGKASRWVRMAQPYAGADYGMHFPLHSGVEVLLTFIDGDPDRPIIAGSVPNPETMSPITSESQTKTMIRTGGGNQIHSEDQDGSQLVKVYSPTGNSSMRVGSPNPGGDEGIELFTERNLDTRIIGQESKSIGANIMNFGSEQQWQHIEGDRKLEVTGKEKIEIDQDREERVTGHEKITVNGGREVIVTEGGEDKTISNGRTVTVNGIHLQVTNNEQRVTSSNAGEIYRIRGGRDFKVENGGEQYEVNGDRLHDIHGNEEYKVSGDRKIDVSGNHTGHASGDTFAICTGRTATLRGGFDANMNIAACAESFVGAKYVTNAAIVLENSFGLHIGKAGLDMKQSNAAVKKVTSAIIKKALTHIYG